MNRLTLVLFIAFLTTALCCTAPPGHRYRCVSTLADRPTDYAISNDKEAIVINVINNTCTDKPTCICVKANQFYVTEYNEFCYPYASICARKKQFNTEWKGKYDHDPLTYYIDSPLTFPAGESRHHKLFLRKAGIAHFMYIKSANTLRSGCAQLGPLITTVGYMKGVNESKTIVKMWQPKTPADKLCHKKFTVTNLLVGPFTADPQ